MNVIKLLQVIVIFVLSNALFAQVPDFSDAFFDLNRDILTPKQVKDFHVKSCTKKSDAIGSFQVFYDGNGRAIKKRDDRTFFIYNGYNNILGGHIFEAKDYNGMLRYAGVYNVKYDSIGRLDRIEYQYSASLKKEHTITQFEYRGGNLYGIQTVGRHEGISGNDIDNVNYFEYDANGDLKEVIESIKETDNEAALYYNYSSNKLISSQNAILVFKYIYDPDGKLTGVDHVVPSLYKLYGDRAQFEPSRRYEYNEHGLISKITDLLWKSVDEYEYEYISPTTISVKLEGGLDYITLFNFSQQYGYKQHSLTNGEAEIMVYTPYKELYVLEISPEFKLPVIFTPGDEIDITLTPDNISFGESDEENAIMLELEMAKRKVIDQNQTQQENAANVASVIADYMKKYPEFIGFLFYTGFWDTKNNRQLFLDYTEKMLKQNPMNFKANEAYAALRQQ